MYVFNDYLHALGKAKNTADLIAAYKLYISKFGMDNFAYLNCSFEEDGAPICRHSYPDKWVDHYFDEKYYEIDPVLEIGRKANLPFTWGQSNKYRKSQQKFMSEAACFGIRHGLTVPSRTTGFKIAFITHASSEGEKEFSSTIKYHQSKLHVASAHFDAKFIELQNVHPDNVSSLTPRELECLKWAVYGKTNPETAEILHISEKTVEAHFTNIFKKLSVFSRTQAVVKGLTLGLVYP